MNEKTNSRVCINKLESTCSREEELANLKKFMGTFAEGTYLSMLFTDSLFDWFKSVIRVDGNPDVLMEYVHTERDLNGRIDDLNTLLSRVNYEYAQAQQQIERMRIIIADRDRQIENKEEQLRNFDNRCLELNDTIEEYQHQATGLQMREDQQREEQQAEIMRLKAMIFDLEHK